jgi:hypothetical protein
MKGAYLFRPSGCREETDAYKGNQNKRHQKMHGTSAKAYRHDLALLPNTSSLQRKRLWPHGRAGRKRDNITNTIPISIGRATGVGDVAT